MVTAPAPLAPPMAPGSFSISSGYGPRVGGFHAGIDYAAPLGTPIYAAASGTVVAAGSASGFGQWIVIDHILDGKKVSTVYGHMYPQGMLVHTGQPVKEGQHIANVGANGEATGPHLHFEVWIGGRLTGGHSVDPNSMLGGTFSGSSAVSDAALAAGVAGANAVQSSYPWSYLTSSNTWIRVLEFVIGVILIYMVMWQKMLRPSGQIAAKILSKGAV
jgi:Peptidase family M23